MNIDDITAVSKILDKKFRIASKADDIKIMELIMDIKKELLALYVPFNCDCNKHDKHVIQGSLYCNNCESIIITKK